METRPFNPTKHVASRLRTDRAISIGDIRTIKHEHQHEPDERVITLTMELSAQELMELELAIENHVKHMRKSDWAYAELKTVQRLLSTGLQRLKDQKTTAARYNVGD